MEAHPYEKQIRILQLLLAAVGGGLLSSVVSHVFSLTDEPVATRLDIQSLQLTMFREMHGINERLEAHLKYSERKTEMYDAELARLRALHERAHGSGTDVPK